MISLPLTDCRNCPLNNKGSIKHNYRGPINADFMFIGSAPGVEEQKTGEVYRGRGGQLQSNILNHVEIIEDQQTFMTNIVMCSPTTPGDPPPDVIKCCSCNLAAQIEQVKPKVLIPIGNPAMKAICKKVGITRWSGMLLPSGFEIPAIPIIQPASALRMGAEVDEDLNETDNYTLLKIIDDVSFAKHYVDTGSETREKIGKDLHHLIVRNKDQLNYILDCMKKAPLLAVDLETTGVYFWKHDIVGVCISWAKEVGIYIPLLVLEKDLPDQHPLKTNGLNNGRKSGESFFDKMKRIRETQKIEVDKKKYESPFFEKSYKYWGDDQDWLIEQLKEVIGDQSKLITNQFIKFDMKFLMYHWRITPNVIFDTMYGAFLLDENMPRGLKENSYTRYPDLRGYADNLYLKMKGSDIEDESYANLRLNDLGAYGCGDADATYRLTQDMIEQINNYNKEKGRFTPQLDRFMWKFMVPLSYVYTEMEVRGITIDPDWCKKQSKAYQKEADGLEERIHNQAYEKAKENTGLITDKLKGFIKGLPVKFNIGSYKQLKEVLFEFVGIQVPPKFDSKGKEIRENKPFWVKTGPSTAKEPMKWYADRYELCQLIVDWRNKVKMISTYFHGFRFFKKDGSTRYLPVGKNRVSYVYRFDAVTGRIRCRDIPAQTVPRDPRARGIIIAMEGKILVEWDWSMAELRLIAWYAQDPVMLEELSRNVDLHKATAAMTYKIPESEVTKVTRKKAKGMNFGAWYGGGDDRLASNINEKLADDEERITPEEVATFRRLLFHKYIPQLITLREKILK